MNSRPARSACGSTFPARTGRRRERRLLGHPDSTRHDTTRASSTQRRRRHSPARSRPRSLTDDGSATVAKADTSRISGDWKKYTRHAQNRPKVAPTTAKARFVLSATGPAPSRFSLVSLFPADVPEHAQRPAARPDEADGGFAARLSSAFPAATTSRATPSPTRFDWKKMIGPLTQRPGHMGCWGYRSSDGFGLPEYLLWCKQLKAEPVLAVFAGYSLNGDHVDAGSPEMDAVHAGSAGGDRIRHRLRRQANGASSAPPTAFPSRSSCTMSRSATRIGSTGPAATTAGSRRSRKPSARNIRTLKIIAHRAGEELQAGPVRRSLLSQRRQLAEMSGPPVRQADRQDAPLRFDGGGLNGRQPNEHQDVRRRVGRAGGHARRRLNAALADAAFMMGLEQNADAVPMECYAPLLVNVNPADTAKGYPRRGSGDTNLIGYDALQQLRLAELLCPVDAWPRTVATSLCRPRFRLSRSVRAGARSARRYRRRHVAYAGGVHRHQGDGPGRPFAR